MDWSTREGRLARLAHEMETRILVTEGAMGTMIQGYSLEEEDYRGADHAGHNHPQKGNNDLLNVSQPRIVREIHDEYLEAGADFIETNTFSTTTIAQVDYGMEREIDEIARSGTRIAREAADDWTARDPSRPRFVVGNLGPTNRTTSISPDVEDPGFRAVSFAEMRQTYLDQARPLVEGGVDVLLIETVFDTLNAKAAIHGIMSLNDELGLNVPMIISGTITDLSGRNLCGQTVAAFWQSVAHAQPLAVGLNCGFGGKQLRPYIMEMAEIIDRPIIAYPNAGLPNDLGGYDEEPETTAKFLGDWAREGLVNIVGGCCGTTPGHIKAIAEAVEGVAPRKVPTVEAKLRLAGLDAFAA